MKANSIKTLTIAALASLLGLGACTNPEVPAGHEGYVHYVPLVFGKMEYRTSLYGPASTGVSWRLFTRNIDMRERNYPEDFELLSSDDLKVAFEVNTRIRLRPGTVKEIVEQWGSENWYEWNVKEPLRTVVRREVMRVSATDIQLKTDLVGKRIEEALLEKYKDTPIDIQSVDIGRFEFPEEVTQAIQQKIAKQQELQRQEFILEKTRKEAAIRVLDALKVAKKQRIISATLDPLYVQWRAVQVYRTLAASPNKTVIMLPNTTEGTGMPLVLTEGKRKVLTAEDEAYLAEMEKRYMDKALAEPGAEPGAGEATGEDSARPAPDGAPAPASSPSPSDNGSPGAGE
jgi:regulator of protease activity HflC (stomatin/prohibitin superfamily)